MTIKLTQQQAQALKVLFDQVINQEHPLDVAEKLVKTIMWQVYKKLRNKLESKTHTAGYSLPLNDTEAMAFYVYFQNRSLGKGWIYEQSFIDAQLVELDKQYV